jgi:DTW domain-containing protein YfiP
MIRPSADRERETFRQNCYRCFKPASHCMCDRIGRVENRTRITILQHPRERFHAIGTARIARLGLVNSSLVVPPTTLARSLAHRLDVAPGTGLLFPGAEARNLNDVEPTERPTGLLVLDGTWSQARKLYNQNAWLSALPHYALTPTSPSRYRIRKEPRESYLSTLEAIVQALEVLEPETKGMSGLLDAFDTMIDDQVVFEHRNPRRKLRDRRRP